MKYRFFLETYFLIHSIPGFIFGSASRILLAKLSALRNFLWTWIVMYSACDYWIIKQRAIAENYFYWYRLLLTLSGVAYGHSWFGQLLINPHRRRRFQKLRSNTKSRRGGDVRSRFPERVTNRRESIVFRATDHSIATADLPYIEASLHVLYTGD